jgi:hypothetical protein
MAENEEESINIIKENIDKAVDLIPVIFSLFGNEDIDTTQFGLTNKSDFSRRSNGECFRFDSRQVYAKICKTHT